MLSIIMCIIEIISTCHDNVWSVILPYIENDNIINTFPRIYAHFPSAFHSYLAKLQFSKEFYNSNENSI